MRKHKGVFLFILTFALLLIYAPILILAVYSFTDASAIGFNGHPSFQNYITLARTPELREMIADTLLLALVVALLSTILGTCGAVGSFYSKHRARSAIALMNQIPVVNADVVTGFSVCILLVVVFGMSKDSYFPLIAGQVTICAPFVYLSVLPRLSQMDPAIYEAALDLGASPAAALRKVVLPQLKGAILSGFAMALTLSLDDYFVATYTKPATFDTISTYVVNATRGAQTSIKTALWALSTLIFVIVVAVVLIGQRGVKRPAGRKEEV